MRSTSKTLSPEPFPGLLKFVKSGLLRIDIEFPKTSPMSNACKPVDRKKVLSSFYSTVSFEVSSKLWSIDKCTSYHSCEWMLATRGVRKSENFEFCSLQKACLEFQALCFLLKTQTLIKLVTLCTNRWLKATPTVIGKQWIIHILELPGITHHLSWNLSGHVFKPQHVSSKRLDLHLRILELASLPDVFCFLIGKEETSLSCIDDGQGLSIDIVKCIVPPWYHNPYFVHWLEMNIVLLSPMGVSLPRDSKGFSSIWISVMQTTACLDFTHNIHLCIFAQSFNFPFFIYLFKTTVEHPHGSLKYK